MTPSSIYPHFTNLISLKSNQLMYQNVVTHTIWCQRIYYMQKTQSVAEAWHIRMSGGRKDSTVFFTTSLTSFPLFISPSDFLSCGIQADHHCLSFQFQIVSVKGQPSFRWESWRTRRTLCATQPLTCSSSFGNKEGDKQRSSRWEWFPSLSRFCHSFLSNLAFPCRPRIKSTSELRGISSICHVRLLF